MSDIILIFVTHYNCFFSEDGSTRLLGYEYILIYSWLPDIRFRPPCGVLMHPLYFSSSGEQYVMQRVRTGPYFFPSLLCCMFMGDIYTVISYRTYGISDEIRRFRLILYVRKGKRMHRYFVRYREDIKYDVLCSCVQAERQYELRHIISSYFVKEACHIRFSYSCSYHSLLKKKQKRFTMATFLKDL